LVALSGLPPRAEDDRVRVLALRGVVDDEAVEVVLRLEGRGVRAGGDDVRRLLEAATAGDDDLAEAAELEVLGDVERLGGLDEHALVLLEVVGARHRQGHRGSMVDRRRCRSRRP
jgi:hypothetical protein